MRFATIRGALMIIKGYRVGPLLKATGKEILDDGILGLSAQTAYYFFFSLFPLFLFTAPLLGLFGDKQERFQWIMGNLATAIPGDAVTLVQGVVKDVIFSESAPGVMSVGALLALWSGSNIFGSLMDALNRAYDIKETRPWWKKKLISIAAALGAGTIILLATIVMIGGEDIARGIGTRMGLGEAGVKLWTVLQFPVAFAFLVATAWGTFYFLPNLRQDRMQVLVGAIVTTVVWILVTLLFRAYVQNFGSYNKTYGTLGGVIALLTWMYLSMLVILSGGELNAEIHAGTGALNTRRGATLAGRISNGTVGRASTERIERVQPMAARGRD